MDDFTQSEVELAGVLGDGALHAGKANLALVRRAIREDWPIPADVRSRLVNQMAKILRNDDVREASIRTVIAAAKVLVAADSVNVRRESLDLQAERQQADVENDSQLTVLRIPDNGRGQSVQAELQAMMGLEPEYLEWRNEMGLKELGVDVSGLRNNPYKATIVGARVD